METREILPQEQELIKKGGNNPSYIVLEWLHFQSQTSSENTTLIIYEWYQEAIIPGRDPKYGFTNNQTCYY